MIKMLGNTYYNGTVYKTGRIYKVSADVKKRWIENGIAVDATNTENLVIGSQGESNEEPQSEPQGEPNTQPAAANPSCEDKTCEDSLREEAAKLGLKPHHNAKAETIQKMIEDKKAELAEQE